MFTQKYDFTLTQQVTESIVIDIKDELQNPRDLTGMNFYLQCRTSPTSETAIFTLTSDGSDPTITLTKSDTTTAIKDRITILLTHDLTGANELNFDKGVYDLLMYNADRSLVEILMSGTVVMKRTVSKLPAVTTP